MKNKFLNTTSIYSFLSAKAIGAILFFSFYCLQLQAQKSASREYQVKAVFLYNFTQFIEWPSTAFHGSDAPFVIGILGNDPFGKFLDEALAGEKIMGHAMKVERYQDVKDISSCHILFINPNYQLGEALTVTRNRTILTVSDAVNFMKMGGMIRFFTQNNKIRLQVNTSAVKSGKLVISSKLLRLAAIYD